MIVQIVSELCFYTDSKQVSNMHKSNHEKNVFSLVAIFLIFTYDKKSTYIPLSRISSENKFPIVPSMKLLFLLTCKIHVHKSLSNVRENIGNSITYLSKHESLFTNEEKMFMHEGWTRERLMELGQHTIVLFVTNFFQVSHVIQLIPNCKLCSSSKAIESLEYHIHK